MPERKRTEVVGTRFGRLSVVEELPPNVWGNRMVRAQCECGNEKQTTVSNLRAGHVRSCGCFRRENARKLAYLRWNKARPKLAKVFFGEAGQVTAFDPDGKHVLFQEQPAWVRTLLAMEQEGVLDAETIVETAWGGIEHAYGDWKAHLLETFARVKS